MIRGMIQNAEGGSAMEPLSYKEVTESRNLKEVCVDDGRLSLKEFIAVAKYHARLSFSEGFCERVKKSRNMIDRFLEENRAIYGVTTGFGENVRYVIEPKDAVQLQKNIVRSHACPVEYGCKEGLSLLNGTGVVTALALLALHETIVAMGNMEIAGAMVYEALKGLHRQLDQRIYDAKQHEEERVSARNMRKILRGSEIGEKYQDARVQDAYILRSMPHIQGAARKLVKEAYEVIINEMHSVSDNPELFDTEEGGVALMCGNFDGSYVGSHADMLAMSCAIAGNLVERSIDRMVNRHINNGLPAFLAVHPGLNNGFMIPQYTAAGLMNEIKILAQPSTIDTITTCANQEDPVSFAYFASKKALLTAKKLQYLVAIDFYDGSTGC